MYITSYESEKLNCIIASGGRGYSTINAVTDTVAMQAFQQRTRNAVADEGLCDRCNTMKLKEERINV